MKQYFSFNNTATRSEYWGVQIISMFIVAALMVAAGLVAVSVPVLGLMLMLGAGGAYLWLLIATAVRRCRDAAISPWWALALVIPYVGFVVWIVIGCLSTDRKNEGTAKFQPRA